MMTDALILKHFWNDPETWRRERWWTVAWLIWGTICAVGLRFGDQSLPEGISWLLASTLIAVFGQPFWGLFSISVAELPSKRHKSDSRTDNLLNMDSGSEPSLYWLEKEQLSILDPNLKCWELYPLVILAVGPIHGLWAGSLLGLAEFFFGDWSKSALQGALVGSLAGIAIVMLLYAIEVAVLITWTHGPKIESLCPLLRQACAVGDNRNHTFLLPGHLLLALFETPTGAISQVLNGAKGNLAEARQFVLEETEQEMLEVIEGAASDEEFDFKDDLLNGSAVLAAAIEEARSLRHADVEAGHVLLGLLKTAPELTTQALKMLGVPTDDLRHRILSCM